MADRSRTEGWLDRLFPRGDDLESQARQREANLVRAALFTLMPVVAFYVVAYGALFEWSNARVIYSAVGLGALVLTALAAPYVGPRRTGRILVVVLVLILLASEHTNRDVRLAALPWLVALPLLATVLGGPRFGVGLAALAACGHLGLTLLEQLGYGGLAPLSGAAPRYDLLAVDTALAMGVVMVVGGFYELSRRRSERLAEHSLTDLRRANRDLREARDAADEANRAKTQFVANISHELRTPMNGVIGMTDLLRSSELSDEQLEYVDTVHRSARSLLGIIDDILDFSRLDFDKLELSVRRYDPETVIEEALSLLAAEAYAKGLEVSATITRDVPSEVISDAGRMRQVLLNLLTNAIKFTKKGEVNLTCSLVRSTEPQALLRFEVNDTGIGIPRTMLPRIFDAFYQTDNSTTRQHGGTGLGLAISKRLVELMGGQIGVDSQVDKGSTFYFTHPVQVPEDVLDHGDERSGTFTGLRGLCLVLGDRPRARRALTALLEREGVLADNAPSLEEALSALARAQAQELPYRVCIVDVPGDGDDALEVADRLRRAPLSIPPAVVLLVPPNHRELRARATALGFATPVSKPARRASLMAGISSALSEVSRTRPNRTESGRVVAEAPSGGRGWLLLAEDNETNRRTATLMLRKLGYDVDVATNGREVLDKLAERRFDAILMDCQMPELDGYQTSTQVRALDSDARHTTIIAMTAHASPGDRRRCLDAGMNDYLPKPVRFEDLRGMLDKWLHGAGPPGALTPLPRVEPATPPSGVDLQMLESLRRMAGEDHHMVAALVEAYLEEAPRIIEELSDRLEAGDPEGAADAVHKLKSSSGNLGANRLSQLCLRLETRARARDLANAPNLLGRIREELTVVEAALAPMRQSAEAST